MSAKRLAKFFAGIVAALLAASVAWAYVIIKDASGIYVNTWMPGSIPTQVRLATSPALSDGTSQSASVVAAMDAWNAQLGVVQFSAQQLGPGPYEVGNGINEIVMDSTIDGDEFGGSTLAVTVSFTDGNERVESDIIFNTAWTWDSYRGNLQAPEDIRRVAIHELGHVLGLTHPDQAGQSVTAIMNSTVSSIDALQSDDIAGGRLLYGAPGFVPANDSFSNASAINMTGESTQVTGTNVAATAEAGEPALDASDPGRRTVWWKWTPPSSGPVTISTLGSNFDTLLGVYTGASVGSLTPTALNDDVDPGLIRTSGVAFTAVGGTTYSIAVDGWGGYFGAITLNVAFTSASVPVPTVTSAGTASVGVGHLFSYQVTASNNPTSFSASGLPDGLSINSSTGVIIGRPTLTGVFPVTLTATNSGGTGSANLTLTVTDAAPVVITQTSGAQVLTPGATLTLEATGFSANGPISYQWMHDGRPVEGATSSSLSLSNATISDSGAYWLRLTNSVGTTFGPPSFVRVAPAVTQVRVWGSNSDGQLGVPAGLTDVVAISPGRNHTLALRRDGSVVAWGSNSSSKTTVPAGLTNVVAIAAGEEHSVALKSDGTVVAWGVNSSSGITQVPVGLTNVVAISTAGGYSVALKTDGTAVGWGSDPWNELGVPSDLGPIVAVSLTDWDRAIVALKSDGTVRAWGYQHSPVLNVPAGLTDVKAIAAGGNHVLALKVDGTLVAWGPNDSGPTSIPTGMSAVQAVDAGYGHVLALKNDGQVVAWGRNDDGQTTLPEGLTQVVALGAGERFSVALRDATADTIPSITVPPASLAVSETGTATFSVTATGSVPLSYQWRKDGTNLSGATSPTLTLANVTAADEGNYDVVVSNHLGSATSASAALTIHPLPSVATVGTTRRVLLPGDNLTLAVTAAGSGTLSYQWRHNGRPIAGATRATFDLAGVNIAHSGWYTADVTDQHGIKRSAPFFVTVAPSLTQVRAWGSNDSGERNAPLSLTSAIAIAAGAEYALALRRDGTVVGWGNNTMGQTTIPGNLADVVAIAAGASHALALKSDGTVVTWGSSGIPVPEGLSDVVEIAAGGVHSLALKSDGTVVAWGLSNGTDSTIPPAGLTNVVAISAGANYSLALKIDGTVIAWGDMSFAKSVPPGLTGVSGISVGLGGHILARKDDGTVAAWGRENEGQSTVPPGLTGVVQVVAGHAHSLARKSDGTVVAWGSNITGESSPPADLTGVFAIAAGGGFFGIDGFKGFSIALRDGTGDIAPGIVTNPASQTVAELQTVILSVAVIGTPELHYQWRKAGTPIAGATSSTLTFASVQLADAGDYDVVVSNNYGSVTSALATLTVAPIPVIASQSVGWPLVEPGAGFNLAVNATGTGVLRYQWTRNGQPIAGATASSLGIADASRADAGRYLVFITDDHGTRRSKPITVRVAPANSQVRIWGNTNHPVKTLPADLNDAMAVVAGSGSGLAIRRNKTVVVWGGAGNDVSNVPSGLDQVEAATAGNGFYLALRGDGTVVGWGSNNYGAHVVPDDLDNVSEVSAGNSHAVALKADGTVIAWGQSIYGQTDVPAGLSSVFAISAGGYHTLALKDDGTVLAWGHNGSGQLNVPSGLSNVVAIAAGEDHSLALTKEGTVVAWGSNHYGETTVPPSLTNVVAVAAARYHSLALRADGTVIAWGSTADGNTAPPADLTDIYAVDDGIGFSLGLHNLSMPVINAHPMDFGLPVGATGVFEVEVGSGTAPLTYQWQRLSAGSGTWTAVTNNSTYSVTSGVTRSTLTIIGGTLAMDGDQFRCVITNSLGVATSNAARLTITEPWPFITVQGQNRNVVEPGQHLNLSVLASGAGPFTYQWMRNGLPISGATGSSYSVGPATYQESGWYVVDVTDRFGVSSRSSPIFVDVTPRYTEVKHWGLYAHLKPPGIGRVSAIASGDHVLALKSDGTVRAWGSDGQHPMTVPADLSGVVAIASAGHAMALKSDGTVTAWGGNNFFGQASVPAGLDDVVAIDAGSAYSLALKSDGTVVAWGSNANGQTEVPAGLNRVIAIAAGGSHALALKNDGTISAWGDNGLGQVTPPSGLTEVVAISAGARHSLALRRDGTVTGWGSNDFGQAAPPPGLTGVVAIAAGAFHSLALKADGTVVAWGTNDYGQTLVPAGLEQGIAISAGTGSSLALYKTESETFPVVTIHPASQTKAVGQSAIFSVTAEGAPPLTYQWRKNGIEIRGATSSTLILENLTTAAAGTYAVVVMSPAGAVLSHGAVLSIYSPPAVTTQPTSLVRGPNQAATFTLTATGTETLDYQWQLGSGMTWQDIPEGDPFFGTNTATLTIAGWVVSALNGIQFRCVITNIGGSVTSQVAVMTIQSAMADLTGDGQSDIIFQNATDGRAGLWRMNGTTPTLWIDLPASPIAWKIVGTADLTGDGQSDILFQNSVDGRAGLWRMNGTTPTLWIDLPASSTDWKIVGTGDFTGDGQSDVIFQNSADGRAGLWRMNGSTPTLWIDLPASSTAWKIVGTADLTGDGQSDVIFQNSVDGRAGLWRMNGTTPNLWIDLPPSAPSWKIVGTGDFTGDGQSDVLFQNSDDGRAGLWRMSGTTPTLWIDLPASSTSWKIVNH